MATPAAAEPERLYARLYDARRIGWTGELELYRRLAAAEAGAGAGGAGVLEVACGTGRVALDLATHGSRVTGFDVSPDMIEIAREKTTGQNPRWLVADMRSFALAERFGLALVPGHAFQFMLTADDQAAALRGIREHLAPLGLLVVHLDHPKIDWLGSLPATGGEPELGRAIVDPATGERYRLSCAWTYERATQTATAHLAWESFGPADEVLGRVEMAPMPLHVVGRVEMEHALRGAGFTIEALHGDFTGGPFVDASSEMVWLARSA